MYHIWLNVVIDIELLRTLRLKVMKMAMKFKMSPTLRDNAISWSTNPSHCVSGGLLLEWCRSILSPLHPNLDRLIGKDNLMSHNVDRPALRPLGKLEVVLTQ